MATRTPRAASNADEVFMTTEEAAMLRLQNQTLAARMNQPEEENVSPEERVRLMLTDIRDDQNTRLKLYRRNGTALAICQDYTPEEFEDGNFADRVRMKWGPGRYDLRLYSSKGVVTSTQIVIQEPVSNPVAGGSNSELSQFLRSMAEQQKAIVEALTRREPAPPPVDPMAQMQQMLQMMVLMREATGQTAPQKSSIGEIVDAIKELKGVSAEINGGPEKEETLMSLAPQVLSLVQQGLQARNAPPDNAPLVRIPPSLEYAQNPAQSAAEQPADQPAMLPTGDAPQIDMEDPEMLEKLLIVSYLNKLVRMAMQNAPIEPAVDIVIEKLPDDMIDLMQLDNWFDLLAANFPGVKPHQAWFVKVRDAVLADLAQDDEPEAQKPGLTG